jgi:PAS domain S-box-containing protein
METKIPKSKEAIATFKAKDKLKFNDLFDLAGDAIFLADIETGKIIDCNKTACINLGYSKEEILTFTVGDLDATNISLEDEQKMWNSLKPNKPITIEGKHKRKDGTVLPVEIKISIIENNGKKEVLGIARDISERKKSEKIIKEKDVELRTAQKIAQLGFYNYNIKNDSFTSSKIFDEIVEFNSKDKKNKELYATIIPQEDIEELYQYALNCAANKTRFDKEYRIITKRTKQLKWIHSLGEITYNDKDEPTSFSGTIQDITSQKNTESELKIATEKIIESELKYKTLYEKAPLAYHSLNENGCFLDINPTWLKILGYKKSEVINKYAGDFLTAESHEKFKSLFPIFKERGYISNERFTMVKKDNTEVQVLYEGCMGYTPEGMVKQTYCTFKDVTEEVKVKKDLIKAKETAEESSRLKSEFLHNMSHEIRTPMNGILGFSDLLGNPNLSVEKQQHFVKIIQNSGKLLLRIIDDILEISRLGTKQVKVFNEKVCLNDLMVELFSIFDAKAKENKTPLYLKTPLSDGESCIETDISKLHKIISNLLENALKYTNKGFLELGYYIEKNNLKIYVKDTGIGILPSKLEVIFDRFTQANEHPLNSNATGLGLGLSIAKENAELLGGDLKVTSEVMKGSEFVLTLPFISLLKKPKKEINKKKNKCKVLIVEDEEVNVLYLETIIHDFIDCNIIHAKNGKEAVELIQQDKNETINLILMDLKMPVMNGFEATKEIKKIRPNAIVIAQTAYSTTNEKQKAFESGCTDFISKPLDKEKLKALLKKYLK